MISLTLSPLIVDTKREKQNQMQLIFLKYFKEKNWLCVSVYVERCRSRCSAVPVRIIVSHTNVKCDLVVSDVCDAVHGGTTHNAAVTLAPVQNTVRIGTKQK